MTYYGNKVAVLTSQKRYEDGHNVLEVAFAKYDELEGKDRDMFKIAKLYTRKARLFELSGHIDSAMKWCEKSLAKCSDFAVKKTLKKLKKRKKDKEAKGYIDVNLSEKHRKKGNNFYCNSNYKAALLEYAEAERRNPKDARVNANKAACYLKLMEGEHAL
jgi:tetratricopeptide (TPR) repeat protein